MGKIGTQLKKEFLDLFRQLCYSRSSWQVWADLMSAFACSIANTAEPDSMRRDSREKEFSAAMERLHDPNTVAKMLACVVNALSIDPEQDFLGSLYMELNLGNHWKGQFFTPYSVSRMMADIQSDAILSTIEKNGWASVCDPCVGAGTLLIATANAIQLRHRNFQTDVLFVGQDVDRITAQMAYVQLALLGCAAVVVVADSLSNPMIGTALNPVEMPGQEFWYTPFWYRDVWSVRRLSETITERIKSA